MLDDNDEVKSGRRLAFVFGFARKLSSFLHIGMICHTSQMLFLPRLLKNTDEHTRIPVQLRGFRSTTNFACPRAFSVIVCSLPKRALYVYLVVTETSQALDIYVFKLGKRSDASQDAAAQNGGVEKKVA